MNAIRLTLTALEPLILTNGSAESMAHQTLSYIPGNMLLGAFAQVWRSLHPDIQPDDDQRFRTLFLEDGVEWGHAYPLAGGKPSAPIPLCFQKVKNHKGLPMEGDADENPPIFNLARFENGETVRDLFATLHPETKGPAKSKKLPEGFMNPQSSCRPDQRQVWNIHVALGTGRSAQEGQLFGYSALAPGSCFQAVLHYRDENAGKALHEVLTTGTRIRVGHARSAGYGLVEQTWVMTPAPAEKIAVKGDVLIFLHSDYIPRHSWEPPVDSLCAELAAQCPALAPDTLDSVFGRHVEIQGFNALWRRPRPSRTALVKGSVLRFRTTEEVCLPRFVRLGADRREGYGRVECEPDFLRDKIVATRPMGGPNRAARPQAMGMTPLLTLLRRRALERQAEALATAWLADTKWGKFLKTMQRTPTQNQRGNLRRMITERPARDWTYLFTAILANSPGRQWKAAQATSPFTTRPEHLHELMPEVLRRERFLEVFPAPSPSLPGPAPSREEIEAFTSKAHRLFLLELLRTWEKMERTKTSGNREDRACAC